MPLYNCSAFIMTVTLNIVIDFSADSSTAPHARIRPGSETFPPGWGSSNRTKLEAEAEGNVSDPTFDERVAN